MEITDKILNKIKKHIPEDKWEEVREYINEEMEGFIPSGFLRKDVVNILDINTGMMPKQRADDYVRGINKEMIQPLRDDGYKILLMGRYPAHPTTSVSYVEKGKLNVISVNVGMMPKPKAETHLRDTAKKFGTLKEDGYDLAFMPVRSDEFQPIVKELYHD